LGETPEEVSTATAPAGWWTGPRSFRHGRSRKPSVTSKWHTWCLASRTLPRGWVCRLC